MKKLALITIVLVSNMAFADGSKTRVTVLPGTIVSETGKNGSYAAQDGVTYTNNDFRNIRAQGKSYLDQGKPQPKAIGAAAQQSTTNSQSVTGAAGQ